MEVRHDLLLPHCHQNNFCVSARFDALPMDSILCMRHKLVMADLNTDAELTRILRETKTIAIVGVSLNPVRASYFVARYLHYRGYEIVPVNPGHAGKELFGRQIVASLGDIPKNKPVDMVDIFRRSEHVPAIVEEAMHHLAPALKTIWMQLGIQNEDAALTARNAGISVVQDRCPKIEYQRLFGELRRAGFNTGIISSKLPTRK